jgi:hypothetical protein
MNLLLFLACSGTPIVGDTSDGTGDDTGGGSGLTAPPLVINEFLAVNDTINADNAGEFDDWVEIYNTGSSIVQFNGIYLSDDPENPLKWALPGGQGIDARGYALFWCDDDDGVGDSGAASQGDNHTSFNLSSDGETLVLTYAEGGKSVQIDAIEFGTQQADIAAARVPDGSLNWQYQAPTPNASNGG